MRNAPFLEKCIYFHDLKADETFIHSIVTVQTSVSSHEHRVARLTPIHILGSTNSLSAARPGGRTYSLRSDHFATFADAQSYSNDGGSERGF